MISNKSKLWIELAKECDTFGEFLKKVLAIRNLDYDKVAEGLQTSRQDICNVANNRSNISVTRVYNLSKTLNIEPYMLNRIVADYKMKDLINKTEA